MRIRTLMRKNHIALHLCALFSCQIATAGISLPCSVIMASSCTTKPSSGSKACACSLLRSSLRTPPTIYRPTFLSAHHAMHNAGIACNLHTPYPRTRGWLNPKGPLLASCGSSGQYTEPMGSPLASSAGTEQALPSCRVVVEFADLHRFALRSRIALTSGLLASSRCP